MQKEDSKKTMLYGALIVSYLFVRYGLFFLHGMKAWPAAMGLLALGMLLLALYRKRKAMQIFAVAGYSLCFLGAKLFSSKSFDPGGGRLDNTWVLWIVSYLLLSLMVFFWKREEKNHKVRFILNNSIYKGERCLWSEQRPI